MGFRYVSIFSGVEAASLAWEPLGWEPVAFSEIEPFPCAVLAESWPDVPNRGDITNIDWKEEIDGAIDLVVGGSPCQSFSVAGKREGLKGASSLPLARSMVALASFTACSVTFWMSVWVVS